ncbi:hypothetical protein G6F22_014815 [Rhizopus arrhizus]|nr:hypothetical protein G6F22_014815 [Rhizopus arrhizus]
MCSTFRQAHPGQHVGQHRRQQHLGRDLPFRQVQHPRHVQVVLRHARHAHRGVDDHRPDRTDENGPDRSRIGRLEQQQPQRQPGQRRHRTQQAHDGREHGADRGISADGKPDRDADHRRQPEADRHALQRRQQVPADALVVGAVVIERIREQFHRRVPGHARCRDLRNPHGHHLPHQHEQREAGHRARHGLQHGLQPLAPGGEHRLAAAYIRYGRHCMPLLCTGRSGLDLEPVGIRRGVAAVPHHTVDKLGAARFAGGQRHPGGGCGLLVDVDAVDLPGHRQIVGMLFQQAPALVLRQEPHAVAQVREVGRTLRVEAHGMLVGP